MGTTGRAYVSRRFGNSDHEAEIALEVPQIREHQIEIGVADAEPFADGRADLVDRNAGQETPRADFVRVIEADRREASINLSALDGAAIDEVMTAPSMVSAIAVGCERATEIRPGEQR